MTKEIPGLLPLQSGEVSLTEPLRSAAKSAAAAIFDSTQAEVNEYSSQLFSGDDRGLTLHFDDVSAIPFLVDIVGVEQYQHRARLRARDGDLMASVPALTPGYENYCRGVLNLGTVECLVPVAAGNLLAVADACRVGSAFDDLCARAKQENGLLIHPYMGIESSWALAREISQASAVKVEVIGPPPPVTWIANDKARFLNLVNSVLGEDWLVESTCSSDAQGVAQGLLDLALRHEYVAIKRLRCASAMGNLVLNGKELLAAGPDAVLETVNSFLERTLWQGDEDVLAVAWEQTDLSPSTQVWIPPAGQGDPKLDGVYDQILEGEEKMFVGSRPSILPRAVQRRLGEAALALASAFQELGYRGRCSFDHLVVGDPREKARLLFIECNGRWGGTSTPMSLLDRLMEGPRPWYRAQDFCHSDLQGVALPDLLDRMGHSLFRAGSFRAGLPLDLSRPKFLFYNVGPLALDGKLDVIALASSPEAADDAIEMELPRILGLS